MFVDRVLSGMRPTGALHLGHYHGVLKNWIRLQHEFQCLFFVADWHALTTHYDTPEIIEQNSRDMAVDWLAAGADADGPAIEALGAHGPIFRLAAVLGPLRAW